MVLASIETWLLVSRLLGVLSNRRVTRSPARLGANAVALRRDQTALRVNALKAPHSQRGPEPRRAVVTASLRKDMLAPSFVTEAQLL